MKIDMPKQNEKKSWEIILPTPLALDPAISDEEIIAEMASAFDEAEVSSILSNSFEIPKTSFIVSCTKEDLFDLLSIDASSNLTIELQEYDDMYLILVLDSNEHVIGRGEIREAGKKVTKPVFRKIFLESFVNIPEKFDSGQKRMNNLAYKLKALRNGMTPIISDAVSGITKKTSN
jgi:hypothetical protein